MYLNPTLLFRGIISYLHNNYLFFCFFYNVSIVQSLVNYLVLEILQIFQNVKFVATNQEHISLLKNQLFLVTGVNMKMEQYRPNLVIVTSVLFLVKGWGIWGYPPTHGSPTEISPPQGWCEILEFFWFIKFT